MSKKTLIPFIIFIVLLVLSVGSTYFYLTRSNNPNLSAQNTTANDSTVNIPTLTKPNTNQPNSNQTSPSGAPASFHTIVSPDKQIVVTANTSSILQKIPNSSVDIVGTTEFIVSLSAAYNQNSTGAAGIILDNKQAFNSPDLRQLKIFYFKKSDSWNLGYIHGGKADYKGLGNGNPQNRTFIMTIASDGKSATIENEKSQKTVMQLNPALLDVNNTFLFKIETPPSATTTIQSLKYKTL